jgi:hypothetical protein
MDHCGFFYISLSNISTELLIYNYYNEKINIQNLPFIFIPVLGVYFHFLMSPLTFCVSHPITAQY